MSDTDLSAALGIGKGEAAVTKLPLMRRAMVRHMLAGADVPCFYMRTRADVTDLLAHRRELKQAGSDVVPSVNDFVVKAVALALRRHPDVNASYVDGSTITYSRINVGVAVAVDGGLVVPTIFDADQLDVLSIARTVRELVDLAERRKLPRELLEDATFTISNLGMFGIEDFDPLINAPHAAILGVGAALPDHRGRYLMALNLGCDHRVLTGAEGAPFLMSVSSLLARPAELLVNENIQH